MRMASKHIASTARWVCDDALLFRDEESPFRAAMSQKATKLVVVTGENASGKSLFVRIVSVVLNQEGIVPVSASIRERTGGGMRQAMMFGEEQSQSTGATSVGVIQTAFKNLDRPSALIIDEPELGLSDAYARALGEYVGSAAKSVPTKCRGVVVVTHSRSLVQGLIDGYGKTPTHVSVAAERKPKTSLLKWMAEPEEHSVEELLALRQVGHERWLRVNKLIKD